MMMQDQDKYYLRLLVAHRADDISRCFVLRDRRTNGHSVGWFDENGRPFILMEDDEELNEGLVQFLINNNVRVAQSVTDLT